MKPHVPQSAFRTPHSAFRIRHGPFAFLIALYLAHTALLIGDGQLALSRLNIRGIDPVAYYSYFHSLYFDHDLEFKNQYDRLGQGFMPDNKTPKGRTANHSSVGPAIALAPFWIGADVVARLGGWKADGTTKPYHVAAFVGLGFYGLVALLLMGLWCMRRFGRWPGAWAAALAWATSSLLYYSFPETLMPHAIGAAAAALFVLAVDSGFLPRSGVWSPAFRRNVADHGEAPEPSFRLKAGLHTQEERAMVPSTRSAALAGAALGLAMLMRWQNALYAVYPLALSFHRLLNSEERRTRARRELVYWIVFGAAALVVFSPQMIVWQILFGTPLTAPQGRGYFFLARFEALRVLFSPHNGLFVWTPGVALAVAGLFVARRADRPAALGLGLVLLAQLGVNSIVLDWHGAWGFSSRRFTESAPIFALGIGSWLALAWGRKWRLAPIGIGILFAVFNEMFVFQFAFHLVAWDQPLTAHEILWDKLHLRASYDRRLMVDSARDHAAARDFDAAFHCLDLAEQVDPEHDDIFETRGQVCDLVGDYESAIRNYDQALALRPSCERVRLEKTKDEEIMRIKMGLGETPLR